MNTFKIISLKKDIGIPFDMTITGKSMNPLFYEGDIIIIKPKEIYQKGDILVYKYKENKPLVHRYLLKKNGRIICKGDNSFRLEDISESDIYGKVIKVIHAGVENTNIDIPIELIDMSFAVGIEYRKIGYDANKIRNIEIYIKFKKSLYQYFHLDM